MTLSTKVYSLDSIITTLRTTGSWPYFRLFFHFQDKPSPLSNESHTTPIGDKLLKFNEATVICQGLPIADRCFVKIEAKHAFHISLAFDWLILAETWQASNLFLAGIWFEKQYILTLCLTVVHTAIRIDTKDVNETLKPRKRLYSIPVANAAVLGTSSVL